MSGGDGAGYSGELGADGARHNISDEDCDGVLVSHNASLVCVTYSFLEEISGRRQSGKFTGLPIYILLITSYNQYRHCWSIVVCSVILPSSQIYQSYQKK